MKKKFLKKKLLQEIILIYRVRHQNPDKSNNFSKQNFINEKIEYYKKFFYISRSGSLQSIFNIVSISFNHGFYSRSEVFACTL